MSKVISASEAAALIKDGATVGPSFISTRSSLAMTLDVRYSLQGAE